MIIRIEGYWNDNQTPINALCMVGEDSGDDDNLFFYFDPDEQIVGNHGEFTVTEYWEAK